MTHDESTNPAPNPAPVETSKVKHGDDKTRAMVRTVMTMEPHPILDFDTLDELHGGLVAQQMRVKRMGGDGEPGEEYWE